MTYTPNWSHARVRSRAFKALEFVEQYTRSNRVNWLSVKEIYKSFGNTSRDLGRYLKEQLLETADTYYNPLTGVCKKYRLNRIGYENVRTALGLKPDETKISDKIETQLISGEFDYKLMSDRLYTPAQFIPKRYRGSILANHGYRYHFDIEAAAPTVLTQRAQTLNPKLKLPTLLAYIENRSHYRKQISIDCGISEHTVKTAINSILQGGVLSRRLQNKTFQALNYDSDAVIKLNHNEFLISLKKDIRSMWVSLRSEIPRRTRVTANGLEQYERVSPRDKAALYRTYELQIGDQIRKIIKKNKIKYLWLHDGWACDQMIDPNVIETSVRQLTGFKIKLDWYIHEGTIDLV
jgi:hypothetical protein